MWCENLYGDQGAQCSYKRNKNQPPTGNIEPRQNEPAYSREHSATPQKRPTANGQKKKIFFFKKPPDAGANSHTARTGGAKPADSGGGGTMLKRARCHTTPQANNQNFFFQDPPAGGGHYAQMSVCTVNVRQYAVVRAGCPPATRLSTPACREMGGGV